jgi:predicted TIM-barrel fold metal-dependent hydrolase
VHEHVRLTTEPLDVPDVGTLVDVLEQLGSDAMLMYASDFPHEHGSAVSDWQTAFTGERLERLLSRNAEECYGFERRATTVAG